MSKKRGSYQDGKKLVINPTEKDVIERIYDLYSKGKSYQQIANRLNEEKVLNILWRDTRILKTIANPLYKGDFISGVNTSTPTYYENVVEPIISKELWEECQVQTRKNSRNYTRRNDYIFFQKVLCPNCKRVMACKSPGGSKKKYIYYQCKDCKTFIREDKLVKEMLNMITTLVDYDINVRHFFAPLLKHKLNNQSDLIDKELYTLNEKIVRLKDAYLNKIIDIKEYKTDKELYENKIKDLEKKKKEEKQLDQYNFSYDDIMLNRDLESIKNIVNGTYQETFKSKWDMMSVNEKQELIMNYIESIEVLKKGNNLEITNINFRTTFMEEYSNLFENGGINKVVKVVEDEKEYEIEVCTPMLKEDIEKYIEKLDNNYPVYSYEISSKDCNEDELILNYRSISYFNTPLKIVPIINRKGITKIEKYVLIEVPTIPVKFVNVLEKND